jgi:hypothetical protein
VDPYPEVPVRRYRSRGRRRFANADLLVPLLVLIVAFAAACASTGSTVGAGVGERMLQRPPYYAGPALSDGPGAVGHFPIRYQRGATHDGMFDPEGGTGSAVAALLGEMNAFLDSLGATAVVAAPVRGTPPDVQFGCLADIDGECMAREAAHAPPNRSLVRLAVARPSPEWIDGSAVALERAGKEYALLITLEVGQLWPEQRNLRGDKVVRLGSGHDARVPWLTSLDAPVSVIQLTGALVGRDGRAVRIGAEGLAARPTPLLASAFGAQRLISDEDVERARTARREDLPGRPLAWQAALLELVAQLTGETGLALR